MSNTETPNATHTTHLYHRLLTYIQKYKIYFFTSVLGFALFAGMEALLVRITEFFIYALDPQGSSKNPLSSFPLNMLPSEFASAFASSILFVPIAIIILSSLRGIGSYFGNFYMGKMGLGVVNDLRKQVFNHMVLLPQSYYDTKNSGELVSLIIYNIEQVTGSVTNAIRILIRDGFSTIAFLTVMLYYNWSLTLIFFVTTPLLAGLVFLAGRYFRRVSRHIQNAVGRVTHISTESFQGIKLVKSFNGETFEQTRFKDAADENLKFGTKFERVLALQTPVLHFVISIAMAVIFLLVLLFWEGEPAEAVTYILAAGFFAKPIRQLSTVNSVIQRGMAASETIFSTLDLAIEQNTGTVKLEHVKGEIELRNVCFSYDKETPVIDDFNLTIPAGKTVALVGSSGSGKSTITNLLLRFYEPDSGQILIDGTPIQTLSLKNLREHISLVNQQTILFNDSVLSNIAYAVDKAEIDEKAVESAAENAYAKQFIEQMEKGFATLVGESGDRLSGGQRQRIAIARALYKNAPILILDEATSALDNESEKQIQLALENLTADRTTLVIAHRLSTIENSDIIVVMDQGKIIEVGDHSSLLEKNGAYAQLRQIQSAT